MKSEDGLGVVVNPAFFPSTRRSHSGLYPSEFPINIMPVVISVACTHILHIFYWWKQVDSIRDFSGSSRGLKTAILIDVITQFTLHFQATSERVL